MPPTRCCEAGWGCSASFSRGRGRGSAGFTLKHVAAHGSWLQSAPVPSSPHLTHSVGFLCLPLPPSHCFSPSLTALRCVLSAWKYATSFCICLKAPLGTRSNQFGRAGKWGEEEWHGKQYLPYSIYFPWKCSFHCCSCCCWGFFWFCLSILMRVLSACINWFILSRRVAAAAAVLQPHFIALSVHLSVSLSVCLSDCLFVCFACDLLVLQPANSKTQLPLASAPLAANAEFIK